MDEQQATALEPYEAAWELYKLLPELTTSELALTLINTVVSGIGPIEASDDVGLMLGLTTRKKRLRGELDTVNSQIRSVSDSIVEEWKEEGTTKTTRNGRTAYLYHSIYASPELGDDENPDHERMCAALIANGHKDIVQERVNAQALSALVRDRDNFERDESTDLPILPPSMAAAIKVSDDFEIRVRKGTAKTNG